MYKGNGNVNEYKKEGNRSPSSQASNRVLSSYNMSESSVNHSNKGEYSKKSNRHKKGGHGQDALDYMDKHDIKYEINIEYNNGVRRGNISDSKDRMRRFGNIQSWFPKEWTSNDIKNAALEVIKSFKGTIKVGNKHTGIVRGVSVTIVFGENGNIDTVYPSINQPGGIKNDK